MPDPASYSQLLRARRTIHDFQPQLPPWQEVEQALQSACFAPNHYFTQPWTFFHLGEQSKQAIVELNAELVAAKKGSAAAQKKRLRWSAVPGWLVVTCQVSSAAQRQQEDYAACCCAVQNLMLDLWARGIGSKWTTGAVTRDARFYRVLGIKPHQQQVVALLWYGYPKQIPRGLRSPLQNSLRLLP